jgi:hypothetical protein
MGKTDKLDALLLPGEAVAATVQGTLTEPGKTSGTTRGLLAVTDKRILFVGTAWGASETRQLVLKQVTAVSLRKNLATAHLEVSHAGGTDRYLVKYKDAEDFARVAQGAVTAVQLS